MAFGVAASGTGGIFVTGSFWDIVDFDPGPGVDPHGTAGEENIYLSKFDTSGNYLWARTWGGAGGDDIGLGVTVDSSGNAYVTGQFTGIVDFDPGSGSDLHSSNGAARSAFLSKFQTNGDFSWARTWGGLYNTFGKDAAVNDPGDLYVTGQFAGSVDFDPGGGGDIHSSTWPAIFLSKFDLNGNYSWARTWGGAGGTYGFDGGSGVAVDGAGNAYVAGDFNGTINFDPGSGTDIHSSNGYTDAFLSKFNSSGDFLCAQTWGGSYFDRGTGVAICNSQSAYVTGEFSDAVDFEPGGGNIHSTNGQYDIFLSKFLSNGTW